MYKCSVCGFVGIVRQHSCQERLAKLRREAQRREELLQEVAEEAIEMLDVVFPTQA